MSRRRLLGGIAPIHILLVVAFLEVAINRVAVPLLVGNGSPPGWYTALDYVGLFLYYFTGTLSLILLLARCASAFAKDHSTRDRIAQGTLVIAAIIAAIPLVVVAPAGLSFPLELAFAVAVIAVVVAGMGRERDLGSQLGLIVLAMPLVVHTVNMVGAKWLWPEGAFDTPGDTIARAGVLALCLAALVSPYVFAPRPFSRAVTRPVPIVFAMTVAATGAVLARVWYPGLAHVAALAIGVELNQGQGDPRLALYLLAVATLTWTLASCALAASPARRQIGIGIALVVLGGYAFKWPNHYVLPLLGLALVADAARRVRDEELEALPIAAVTPPIEDAGWATYINAVKSALETALGGSVHTLTTRGEAGLATSLLLGEKSGLPVRTRIERWNGSVIALDVTIGKEIDEVRGATLCLWAIPARTLGVNPAGPIATPTFKAGEQSFDERFKLRGSALAFTRLFDEGLRARAVATLDGWLAYWEREGLRYRVYPGRGAPLDHPMPLSDLALNRAANPERLVAVVELLVEIGIRGVDVAAAEPTALDEPAEPAEPTP